MSDKIHDFCFANPYRSMNPAYGLPTDTTRMEHPTPVRDPEIQMELKRLLVLVEGHEKELTSFYGRLSPILRPIPTAPTPAPKEPHEMGSPLGETLREIRRRLERSVTSLQNVKDCCEL